MVQHQPPLLFAPTRSYITHPWICPLGSFYMKFSYEQLVRFMEIATHILPRIGQIPSRISKIPLTPIWALFKIPLTSRIDIHQTTPTFQPIMAPAKSNPKTLNAPSEKKYATLYLDMEDEHSPPPPNGIPFSLQTLVQFKSMHSDKLQLQAPWKPSRRPNRRRELSITMFPRNPSWIAMTQSLLKGLWLVRYFLYWPLVKFDP